MTESTFSTSYTLSNISSITAALWEQLSAYPHIAFSGEMGAGKTTLIHHLCDMLQVQDSVSSPTFALINEYHFNERDRDVIIYHMDWYRIKSEEELLGAGIEDCMRQAIKERNYCFVEWPEKAPGMLQKPYAWVNITLTDETTRSLNVTIER
jgi:tRNA threonylcarbamoyladenosine biosynthesis protein TsaE